VERCAFNHDAQLTVPADELDVTVKAVLRL